MQRFTISLDVALAAQFDDLIAGSGYVNRSEAVRDLIRSQIGSAHQAQEARQTAPETLWCVATISYVYSHHDRTVTERVLALQHDYHDLVVTSLHTHLDHDHCLENVVLRGMTTEVRRFAQLLVALRGVRHGNIHVVPLASAETVQHSHAHFKPIN